MCTSRPPDPSKELRRQEAERQARVAQGTALVDKQFAGFNDDWHNQRKQAEIDYYLPNVDEQYRRTYQDAVFRLANTGGLTSTAGADLLGRINKQYELGKQQVLDRATASALGLKSDMSRNRADLIRMLEGGSSVASVGDSAAAMAQARNAAPSYSPLGDLFAGITGSIANTMLANAINPAKNEVAAPGMPKRAGGSVYTIGA